MLKAVQDIWSFFDPIQDDLVGLGFALLLALIVYVFRPQVKLIYGTANNSRNVVHVPDPNDAEKTSPTEIYVEKYFLQNVGRKPASDVEFVLSAFPTDISVFQPRNVQYKQVEKGNCLVSIPRIAPGELVIIDCAYINQKASWVSSVKCAECLGRNVPFFTLRQFPRWVYATLWILIFLGVAMAFRLFIAMVG